MGSIKFCGVGGRTEHEDVMRVALITRFDTGTTLNMNHVMALFTMLQIFDTER